MDPVIEFRIKKLIADEINAYGIFENHHGISTDNIDNFLVEPYKKYFYNFGLKNIEAFLVVLDEDKNNESDGYLLFYSEADDAFGLGTKNNKVNHSKDVGIFLGIYGSFIEALNAM